MHFALTPHSPRPYLPPCLSACSRFLVDHGFADLNRRSLNSILRDSAADFRSQDPRAKAAPRVSGSRRQLPAREQAELDAVMGGQGGEEAEGQEKGQSAGEDWVQAVRAHFSGGEAGYLQRSYGELVKPAQQTRKGRTGGTE